MRAPCQCRHRPARSLQPPAPTWQPFLPTLTRTHTIEAAAALQIAIQAEDWHGALAHAGDEVAYLKAYPLQLALCAGQPGAAARLGAGASGRFRRHRTQHRADAGRPAGIPASVSAGRSLSAPASMPAPTSGLPKRFRPAPQFLSRMRIGAARCWRGASRMVPLRNSRLPIR